LLPDFTGGEPMVKALRILSAWLSFRQDWSVFYDKSICSIKLNYQLAFLTPGI
jgi:hypothetical protein